MTPTPEILSNLPCETKSFVWRIDDYKKLRTLFKSSTADSLKQIAQLDFEIGSTLNSSTKWRLFLREVEHLNAKLTLLYMGLLDLSTNPEEAIAEFDVTLCRDEVKGLPMKTEIGYFYKGKIGLTQSWAKACTISKLSLSDGFGFKDWESIKLEINVKFYTAKNCVQEPLNPHETAENKEEQWRNQFQKKIIGDLAESYESASGTDVILAVGEDTKIKAHKYILSMRSSVMAAMFQSGMIEATTGVIQIEDMSPKSVKIMVKFMYSGVVDSDWGSSAEELIYAADKYRLDDLKSYLDENIGSVLTAQNVLKIRNVAKLYKLENTLDATVQFVRDNAETFLDNVGVESGDGPTSRKIVKKK